MITKKISWETYVNDFYKLIKVNDSHTDGNYRTIIFYKIEDGVLYISFTILDFYIITKKSVQELKQEYNEKYEDGMETSPLFIDYINMIYMDSRGYKEL